MNIFSPLSSALKPETSEFLFRIGMWWRIVYGAIRLVVGVLLLRVIGTPLLDILYHLVGKELVEDPNDFLLQTVAPFLEHSAFTVTYFLATYIIFFGIIDIVLSICLLRHRLWAFTVSIYLIGGFVLYEVYRLTHTHSVVLAFIIVVDLAVLLLIRREYLKLQQSRVA